MSKLREEEKKRNKKLNEAFLYDLSYYHSENICEETDKLLEQYKDLELPDSLDTCFEDYSRELEKKEKIKQLSIYRKNIAKRAAIFIIAFILLGVSLTLGVEAFRIRLFNLFITRTDHYTDLSIKEKDKGDDVNLDIPKDLDDYYYPYYLPEGYKLGEYALSEGFVVMHLEKGSEDISIYQTLGESDAISRIDTEGVAIQNISVRGNDAIYVFKGGNSILAWLEDDTLIEIVGPISKEEILKMANNLEKK